METSYHSLQLARNQNTALHKHVIICISVVQCMLLFFVINYVILHYNKFNCTVLSFFKRENLLLTKRNTIFKKIDVVKYHQ